MKVFTMLMIWKCSFLDLVVQMELVTFQQNKCTNILLSMFRRPKWAFIFSSYFEADLYCTVRNGSELSWRVGITGYIENRPSGHSESQMCTNELTLLQYVWGRMRPIRVSFGSSSRRKDKGTCCVPNILYNILSSQRIRRKGKGAIKVESSKPRVWNGRPTIGAQSCVFTPPESGARWHLHSSF
jgi:hypothetical protein